MNTIEDEDFPEDNNEPKAQFCSTKWLAEFIGITVQQTAVWSKEGVIPRPQSRNTYDVFPCLKGVIRFYQAESKKVSHRTANDKARQAKAEADTSEVEAALKLASVVPADAFERQWEDVATKLRVIVEVYPGLTEAQKAGLLGQMQAVKLGAAKEYDLDEF